MFFWRYELFCFVYCVHKAVHSHMHTYYTSAHRSGRRYYILPLKFFSFFSFFSFAAGSPRWLYRQGTFLAQMVGYRCNFKIWVENLGGNPPLKFGGPKPPPNVVTQSQRTWSKLILGIGRENEYPKLVSKFWGLPPKKFERGQSSKSSILKLALLRGHGSHSLQIFTSGSGS